MKQVHLVVGAGVAAMVVALSGCSGAATPSPSGSDLTATSAGSGSAQAPDSGSTDSGQTSAAASTELPPPPEGAAADLQDRSCEPDDAGLWTFTATLTNSSDRASTYTVLISIVSKQGSTVLISESAEVTVEPGQSAPVSIGPLDPQTAAADAACVPTTTVNRG